MRTFVMGDIHGAWKALKQCLERSRFDYENDLLIQLGDIADGHADVYRCIEELLSVRHLIAIKGNHDDWFTVYLQTGIHPDNWRQGGWGTATSYLRTIDKDDAIKPTMDGYTVALNPADLPESHRQFFDRQHLYYIDERNNCYVHAGFMRDVPFKGQSPEVYMWDRKLWEAALSFKTPKHKPGKKGTFNMVTPFHEVFIGHTSTTKWNIDQPMHAANIWNLDTGAGHDGKLTIMDVDTKQFWQSDAVTTLYEPVRW
jgi:serine/threonine protein phosphatase 1